MKLQNLIRKDSLLSCGFGTDAMKRLSVCPNCHSLESSDSTVCSICKTRLAKSTLYDIYKSRHRACSGCGTIITAGMQFCPHCGQLLNPQATLNSV